MNTIAKYMLSAAVVASFAACSPDEFDGGNANQLPTVEQYADLASITVDQTSNIATFKFNGASAPGVYPIWIIDGETYDTGTSFTKYYRKAGTYTAELKIGNRNGISDASISKSFTIENTKLNGFGGFDFDSSYNLWKTATVTAGTCYYAPGWSQIADPAIKITADGFSYTLSEATSDQWQAQIPICTNINLQGGHSYDISFILTSNKTIKNKTIKLQQDDNNDNALYYATDVSCEAEEPVCYYATDIALDNDLPNLRFLMDWGGTEAGTEIRVESVVIKDHANDDGTVVPEKSTEAEFTWENFDSANNLWYNATLGDPTFYYAPGWSPIDNPEVTTDGRTFWTLKFPSGTWERWQNQFAIPTDIAWTDPNESLDMKITVETNQSFTAMFKLTQDGNDDNYFFATEKTLYEGENTFWVGDVTLSAGSAAEALKMVFDFGTNPDGTEVTIKNIIIQKHQ